ncbi:hypothetical protein DH2020_039808 [Rehmannia glutinosa]|uniref:Rho GTPase-activating protein n=1 Tax=Rehmannia glutinosa TaxID=99300 RepID=A0ABR0UWW5_REHGL
MTDILLHKCSPPHGLPSPSSSINCATTPKNNDGLRQQTFLNHASFINSSDVDLYRRNSFTSREIQGGEERGEGDQVSVLAVLLTVCRKSLVGCNSTSGESIGVEEQLMEIGCPTNVRHVAHVTFDRFNGFLGLPVEFEPEVPRRPPSASWKLSGRVHAAFVDSRGNCVPTILLMMQRRLYSQGGLQSEGIFRINPENGQEEYVREQLNNGVIPDNIDVHCLAGLIKAWFRELPSGILDSLPPEQVMEAQSEDECTHLVRLLPPTEAALLDWAINLMADVAQLEHFNKMNARNIAMVFAPNMTQVQILIVFFFFFELQMSDPLTALMFAVQPSDKDGHYSLSKPATLETNKEDNLNLAKEKPLSNQISNSNSQAESRTDDQTHGFLSSIENIVDNTPADNPNSLGKMKDEVDQGENTAVGIGRTQRRSRRGKLGQPSNNRNDTNKKGSRKQCISRSVGQADENVETKKELDVIRRVNSHVERVETWR